MRLAALAMLAACGGTAVPPDASPPTIDYRLSLGWRVPRRDVPVTIWIDGTQALEIHETYDRAQARSVVHHTVELRYQDTVIYRRDVATTLAPCNNGSGDVLSYSEGIYELDSGDLRAGGADIISQVNGVEGHCIADSFDRADCWPTTDSMRCAPVIELDAPRFTRLAWVPPGTKQKGDACTFTPDPGGAYDDCGKDLFCYQGTCHGLCFGGPNSTPISDEYAPEVELCD